MLPGLPGKSSLRKNQRLKKLFYLICLRRKGNDCYTNCLDISPEMATT
jgi:hypothetical protein